MLSRKICRVTMSALAAANVSRTETNLRPIIETNFHPIFFIFFLEFFCFILFKKIKIKNEKRKEKDNQTIKQIYTPTHFRSSEAESYTTIFFFFFPSAK
jgi:hypothetical protein